MNLSNKRILAIDYGRKVTGLASYHVDNDPYPIAFDRIIYQDDDKLLQDLTAIVDNEVIDLVVIGVPYFTDGTESTNTKQIKAFAQRLRDRLNVQVFEEDETLTTFEAEERMKADPRYNFKVDPKKIDELCAVIILEQFYKNSQKN